MRTIYLILRTINDIKAIWKGRTKRRIARRVYGKATGRIARRWFG